MLYNGPSVAARCGQAANWWAAVMDRRIDLSDEVPELGICYTTTSKWVRIGSTAMNVDSSKNRHNRVDGGYLQRWYRH